MTSTAPADGSTVIGTNSKVVAVFNNAVSSETVNEASFTLQGASEAAINGPVSYDAPTKTATLSPGSKLSASTVYTATVSTDVEDGKGHALVEDFVWSFETGVTVDTTAPELNITATNPANGETGVLRNIKLNMVFTEAIDPATVRAANITLTDDTASEVVAGTLSYVNPTTVVFSPDTALAVTTPHTLSLSTSIKDLAGIALAATSLTFTTGADISSSPAAVDLGSAGNYVLLTKTGITTTGTTDILGDIAVSPGALSLLAGFDYVLSSDGTYATSALVTGKLFGADMAAPIPKTLTTAVSDMETAYAEAAGRTDPDFTELGAGEIGGLTLDPGLYKWGSVVLVTSDVTLNGSATDVWIFQIDQDLKLQDGKSIILTGGALPQNIFWQVAGEVTLQAGTTFNGVILGKTAVAMKSGAVLNGRALVQTAVTLIGNDVNQPAE
ncbi:ice-binding family protein [Marinobacter salicampi]|uniref:ice-binding family protein n=1 Tax=Marinobacter salicampi TaxID=435907 RepID=UPI0014075E6D|nr:ice-binding family protein [Marinobacter salicampi]